MSTFSETFDITVVIYDFKGVEAQEIKLTVDYDVEYNEPYGDERFPHLYGTYTCGGWEITEVDGKPVDPADMPAYIEALREAINVEEYVEKMHN